MTVAILPERRDFRFKLDSRRIHDWNGAGVHWTQFMNTLSLFFPAGERFFIDSVRHYRDQVTDPQLMQAVKSFIGQEAMHTREHVEYNEAMRDGRLPAEALQRVVALLLKRVKHSLPAPARLGATIALEHLTALLADMLLRDPLFLRDSDPRYAALWVWHAVEETEHKGVAFDVYEQVMGKGMAAYALRIATFLLANVVFWLMFYPFYLLMVQRSGRLFDARGWWTSMRYQWGVPGALRRIIPGWLEYFRPDFHPWDQDNRHHLARVADVREALWESVTPADIPS